MDAKPTQKSEGSFQGQLNSDFITLCYACNKLLPQVKTRGLEIVYFVRVPDS